LASVGVGITLDNPWWGIGQDSFPLIAQPYANDHLPLYQARLLAVGLSESPHNTLLSISTGSGIPGLLAYLAFFGTLALRMVTAHRSGNRQALPVLMILVGYFVSSLFMTPEVSSSVSFWLVAGAACSAVRPLNVAGIPGARPRTEDAAGAEDVVDIGLDQPELTRVPVQAQAIRA
jgi:O-antigen ligase